MQRLLQRRLVAEQETSFYIHPKRELSEYFCFLQAILDDTDLLTKVSDRDLTCVAQLLNRMKSLALRGEVEIISFDDIPHDKQFTQAAAQRILQQRDMYSIYKKSYHLRELEVESNLALCAKGQPSNIFVDAKEQNGCTRVGQTKMFAANFPYFFSHIVEIRQVWLNKSQEVYHDHPEIDLHLHMISTIASAEEVYKNQIGPYTHQDELWIWTPPMMPQGYHHLRSFLAAFHENVKKFKKTVSSEFIGSQVSEYQKIFNMYLADIPQTASPSHQPEFSFIVLRFKAGALNSRKSMITPCLPRLLT